MRTRSILSCTLLLGGIASCSGGSPAPGEGNTVLPPSVAATPAPAPESDKPSLVYFEGSVDVKAGTMTVATRSPTGELRTAATLPYGQSSGDVYFHTCAGTVSYGSHQLSGTVQAVNLASAPTVTGMTAVIDSTSSASVTFANPIASYGSVAMNTASNCGSPSAVWTFNDLTDTNFTFNGHAVGTPTAPGTGLLAWLAAGDVVASNGAGVSTWPDRSGNGNSGTATNGQPTFQANAFNGQPALHFAGAPYYQLPNAALPTGNSSYTLVVVASAATTARAGLVCGGSTAGHSANCFRTSGPDLGSPYGLLEYWYGDDLYTAPSLFTANQAFAAATRYTSGGVREIWLNGALKASDTPGTDNVPPGPMYIGTTFVNEFLTGNIAEVLIYNSALSDANLGGVFSYLKTKYGIP